MVIEYVQAFIITAFMLMLLYVFLYERFLWLKSQRQKLERESGVYDKK